MKRILLDKGSLEKPSRINSETQLWFCLGGIHMVGPVRESCSFKYHVKYSSLARMLALKAEKLDI